MVNFLGTWCSLFMFKWKGYLTYRHRLGPQFTMFLSQDENWQIQTSSCESPVWNVYNKLKILKSNASFVSPFF